MGKRDVSKIQNVILTCNGSDCRKRGAKDLQKCAQRVTKDLGQKGCTMFMRTKCAGLCKQGPVVVVQPANRFLLAPSEQTLETVLRDVLTPAAAAE